MATTEDVYRSELGDGYILLKPISGLGKNNPFDELNGYFCIVFIQRKLLCVFVLYFVSDCHRFKS